MSEDVDPKKGCAALWVLLLLVPVTTVLRGWVFLWLWLWFIVPIFHQTALSIPQALGLGCIATFWHQHPEPAKTEETFWPLFTKALVRAIGAPLLALLHGWIIHLFM